MQTPDGPLFHAYLATLAERQVVIVDDDNDDVILESSGVLENLLAPKGQTAPWRKMSFKKEG